MTSLVLKNNHGSVEQVLLSGGIAALKIEHTSGTALISLYAGQLLEWQPKNHHPVFWLSKTAYFQRHKAIRGGIPICWPWFGRHEQDIDNTAINHGFARINTWQVDAINLTTAQVKIVLSLTMTNGHNFYPQASKLTQSFVFSNKELATLKHSLTMSNLSAEDVYYTGALHSYFAVSSPKNTTIPALETLAFDDMLIGEYCSAKPLNNSVGPIDRNYHKPHESVTEPVVINDSGWHRKITVSAQNSQHWILWNPGIEIASQMNDVHQGGADEFVCLEVANTKKQKIRANETVTLAQTINIAHF